MSDTLLEPEDQIPASAHRVNSSGNCSISGCPCRGWSAQETAGVKETTMTTEERIKQIPACVECGAVQFARYGHFPECSQFIADLDKLKSDSEHEPAARGGSEGAHSPLPWSDTGMHIRDVRGLAIASVLSPLGKFSSEEIDANAALIIESVNQHQSLVAEREGLRKVVHAAVHVVRSYQYGNSSPDLADEFVASAAKILNDTMPDNEQRSTSE